MAAYKMSKGRGGWSKHRAVNTRSQDKSKHSFREKVKTRTLEPDCSIQNPALPFSSCVTLGSLLSPSVLQITSVKWARR